LQHHVRRGQTDPDGATDGEDQIEIQVTDTGEGIAVDDPSPTVPVGILKNKPARLGTGEPVNVNRG